MYYSELKCWFVGVMLVRGGVFLRRCGYFDLRLNLGDNNWLIIKFKIV